MEELKKQFESDKRFGFIAKLHKKYSKATVFLVGGATRDLVAGNSKSETRNPKSRCKDTGSSTEASGQIKNSKLKIKNLIPAEDLDFVVGGIDKDELEKFLGGEGIVKDVESRVFGVFKFVPKKVVSDRHSCESRNPRPNGSRVKPGMTDKEATFDIAVPRTDRWTGEGYKDVKVETKGIKIEDDLSRRDFTINAMALNLRTYEILDKFGGQEDLKNKIIRAVGKPEDRFQEDPSRILRAVRFAITLDFKIEPKTLKAMKEKVGEVREPLKTKSSKLKAKYRVAEEVIAKEFLKAFDKEPVKTIEMYDQVGLLKLLMSEVEEMKSVKQPKKYHSEGDVYEHTLLCLERLKTQNSKLKTKGRSINLKLGLLFHDIGKPATFCPPQFKGDRIHFNEHDEVGAEITRKIIKRLKLTSAPKGGPLHVDKEVVVWLVKKHMILITARSDEMRLTTFEKYFFRDDGAGDELLDLAYIDISATVPPSGKPDFSTYNEFTKKIEEIRDQVEARKLEKTLPPPLITGNDVMKALKIKSGPKVGKILKQMRELQLRGEIKNKKEALEELQRWNKA